ncbi:uncharacterized protein LOC101891531 [Musca domestica]|uniref:Uncharacterized protein LOC101891531 n=1 Tax=Musca domestica TaxID=7370 RepID=A0A9J7CVC2_MUSDO|nr:uncharacterized protein LOC101891531 [Musca domestica]
MDFSTAAVVRYLLLIVAVLNSASRSHGTGYPDDCFDHYTAVQNENVLKNQNLTLACKDENTRGISNRISKKSGFDVEFEKENFAQTADEMCNNMKVCEDLEDPREFLQCYIKATQDGFHKSMHMNFNATLILIELNDEYEENDKGVMRCIQRSKEVFVKESLAEYNRLLQCLGY